MRSQNFRVFLTWTLAGAAVAIALIATQMSELGGMAGLLQVGEVSPLRPLIEKQLGDIPLASHVGHDGQIYYAIGLDLRGETVGDYFIDPAYRYRRILFSAFASVFGLLDGAALLTSMVVIVVVSMAVATGAVAVIARLLGGSEWLSLSVLLNPGMWLSVRLLTPEIVAGALMVVGMMVFLLRRTSTAHVAFSMSVLTKESFLLTPLGIGVSRDKRRWLVAAVPTIVIFAWSLWGQVTLGGLTGEANNLALPFTGIFRATEIWHLAGPSDWFYLVYALGLVGVALLVGIFRRGWLRWSLLGWAALGLCSSEYVWRIGNNAARVFGPILILIVLHVGTRLLDASSGPANESEHTGARVSEAP